MKIKLNEEIKIIAIYIYRYLKKQRILNNVIIFESMLRKSNTFFCNIAFIKISCEPQF